MSNHDEGLRAVITPQLSDMLYTLAAEYSLSTDLLVNMSVRGLIDDVELFRNLRADKIKSE